MVNAAGEVEKAGCVVIDDAGRYLLVRSKEVGTWGLPKGHIEKGESSEHTAVRETKEETGVDVTVVRQLPDFAYFNSRIGQPVRLHFFLARPVGGASEIADEFPEWVSLEVAKQRVYPNQAEYLEQIQTELVVD